MKKLQNMIFGIDFDGTCVTHEYPNVGRDIGAQKVLQKIVDNGGLLILWTMRSGKTLEDAVKWFEDNKLPLYGVNNNPEQILWTQSPKAYAHLYIDDAALGCPLKTDSLPDSPHIKNRPYVDWEKVEKYLDRAFNLE